mgnify:CR=1 FL=1|tara:strand:+ start:694 stop:795 length:102 start_codon:yes stop_codon:yes gene_type:complete
MAAKDRTKKFPQIKEKNEGKFTSWAKNFGCKKS